MDPLVYPRERTLATITLILGILVWLVILFGTFGLVLLWALIIFIAYLFAQSAFIAWIKGTALKLSPEQHPDLYERYTGCCDKLSMRQRPDAYIVEGGGLLNAFATRFLGRNFVVLLSDVIDALEDEPEGLDFYFGHELGHIRRGHLTGRIWRMPVLWIPLLGGAYARACEYTCDLHGRACCADPRQAARALMVLAAGTRRWKTSNLDDYANQSGDNSGFWGSFHELLSGYPWLTKRVQYVLDPTAPRTGRNPLSYILALFVPYSSAGPFVGFIYLIVIIYCVILVAATGAVGAGSLFRHGATSNTDQDLWKNVAESVENSAKNTRRGDDKDE